MPHPLRLAALLSLMACASMAGAAHHSSTVRHRVGPWRLVVETDSFAGRTACSLTAPHLSYERGALLVHLPRRVDTMNAVYRLDAGPPITAALDEPRLAQMGFALRLDNLDNPSGGLVRIPIDRVGTASRVQVEALPKRRVWTFPLKELQPAIAQGKSAGCP